MKKKALATVVATSLLIGGVFGGTLAYLMDTTQEVENTFTIGSVDVELEESNDLDLKMEPSITKKKDPKVTVAKGSESCYLFVKAVEANNEYDFDKDGTVDKYILWDVRSDWTKLDGEDNVWYRTVTQDDKKDQVFYILTGTTTYENGSFSTNEKVTVDGMKAAAGNEPSLTFKAYAVQQAGIDSAAEAWAKVPTRDK